MKIISARIINTPFCLHPKQHANKTIAIKNDFIVTIMSVVQNILQITQPPFILIAGFVNHISF
jgi:hypothetical protein